MNTVSLKVTDDAIMITNQADHNSPQHVAIAYAPDQSIGANLENIRVHLVGIDFDAIIINNPLQYPFSDTVVGLNHQRIDIGLALMNMFNKPVVALPTVQRKGLQAAVAQKRDYAAWHLDYYGQYQGKRNFGQEAMLTIGNGFMGLRGAYVEAHADADNYPGLYVAGMYNQNTTPINGKAVVNEDLVNLPNAQYLSFGIDHGQPFTIDKADIKDIYRSLDLHTGQVTTTMLVALGTGHQLLIETTKVAGMTQWHHLAIRYRLTPLNFAGSLQIYSGIDATVQNHNVPRYDQFDAQHITVSGMSSDRAQAAVFGKLRHNDCRFAIGTRLDGVDPNLVKTATHNQRLIQSVDCIAKLQQPITLDKRIVVYTSRETAAPNPAVWQGLEQGDFEAVAQDAKHFYSQVWQDADIQVGDDLISQKLLRVNIFQMYVAGAALADGTLDASVGARGLHGEAYRGHVFWDEMFMMPFYAQHAPKLAKAMLMYRDKRLPQAQAAAKQLGLAGAMYPWQSGASGDEQAQALHLNPLTNHFDPDESRRQRHVSLAIAYDIWLYDHFNADQQFMQDAGMPMLVAIARFWLSLATKDDASGRYHIAGVMGPDEFHENYPNAKTKGLTDNAYTNLMVAWLFKLLTKLKPEALSQQELTQLDAVRRHLSLDIDDAGIIGQFAGYFKLPTLDFEQYRKQYGDIARMDRILKAEGKTPDAYQVAKQADTLMAFYLLDEPTVTTLISEMGYHLPADYFSQNLAYYLDRTTHGSTLSRIVYAVLDARANHRDQSWQLYHQALLSDYYDIQGGTTAEGLHLGVMGATLDVAARVYAGVDALGDTLVVKPQMPAHWHTMHLRQHYRGITYDFTIDKHVLVVQADHDTTIQIGAKKQQLIAHQQTRCAI